MIGLFVLASLFFGIYLVKSTPKMLPSGHLGPKMKVYGLLNNVVGLVGLVVVIVLKVRSLL